MINHDQIAQTLLLFEQVGLEQAQQIKLEDRVDHKYILNTTHLPTILKQCQNEYKVLELNRKRWAAYHNLYFDTKDFTFYHQHHAGKLNRLKLRIRTYAESGQRFLEIKSRTNKGRTQKKRIETNSDSLDKSGLDFIYENTGVHSSDLFPAILVSYNRITLVNKQQTERITIDIDLKFTKGNKEKKLESIAIIEVKQNIPGTSHLKNILHLHKINEGTLSKYCLGISHMIPDIKQNLFKEQHLAIDKLIENGYRIN